MKYYALALISFMLTACSSVQTNVTPVLPETPALQQELLEPCEALPKLEEREYTQQESYETIKVWLRMYYDCAKKHEALANLLDSTNHK